ncbi:MAG: hypothetical protein JJU36_15040 [Phycisphaeraceae bacterium]|nr:hypothetical protein [Phycisphaeraceae bacterium]
MLSWFRRKKRGPAPKVESGDSFEDDLVRMRQGLLDSGMPEEAVAKMCQQFEEEIRVMAEKQSRPDAPADAPTPPPSEEELAEWTDEGGQPAEGTHQPREDDKPEPDQLDDWTGEGGPPPIPDQDRKQGSPGKSKDA